MNSPKSVVAAWAVAFNNHDLKTLAKLYHPDAVNHQVAAEPVRGRQAILDGIETGFALFPDMGFEVVNLFEDGEWAILEWYGWSTHRDRVGEAEYPGKDGERMHGCGFFRVREGQIVHQRGYWDKLTWQRLSGAPQEEMK